MQSGISASVELQSAFRAFTSDSSLFALPVTIRSESLVPLDPIAFASSSPSFKASLPSLQPQLEPKTPLYLILRRDDSRLVAVTYIPSIAPVRSKTLFASTRATLVRELGTEKFDGGTIFVTEPDEVLDVKEWDARDGGSDTQQVDEALLTREERELQGVKRAEEEERFGTRGRDLGTFGGGNNENAAETGGEVGGQSRLAMKTEEDAQDALREALKESGGLVILGIDVPSETVVLHSTHHSISPNELSRKIPSSQPSYVFYHYPTTSTILFVYTCPAGMPIKSRMLYAASRRSVLKIAETNGVEAAKKIEAGSPEEVDEHRVTSEMDATEGESGTSTPVGSGRQGFARPKKPGRR